MTIAGVDKSARVKDIMPPGVLDAKLLEAWGELSVGDLRNFYQQELVAAALDQGAKRLNATLLVRK
jgi:hypothetical protein